MTNRSAASGSEQPSWTYGGYVANGRSKFGYTAGSAATTSMRAVSICVRRIGRNTNHAISAAIAFMMLAVMKTACQLPVIAASTLDRGTRSEAVPLAV